MASDELETVEGSGGSEGLEGLAGTDRINAMLSEQLGPEMAEAYATTRLVHEQWARRRHPHEGLRDRKKRLTRQQISDVATALFIVRGFERVTVAQIAEIVGVSEKTVFNYFPTKESLVFDQADEDTDRLAAALRERSPGESPTRALLHELAEESRELEELPEGSHMMLPLFAEMIAATPALRAAWLELQDRLVAVVTAELADHAELDPREPEPMIAARAIAGLIELSFQSRIRHVEEGRRGQALGEAVADDLERAARLLDTGLWSFSLLSMSARSRAQVRDAAAAAEETRKQVMDALKLARSAWQELRKGAGEEIREQREEIKRAAKAQAGAAREETKRAAKARAAIVREEAKRAAKAKAAIVREETKRATKAKIAHARAEAGRAGSGAGRHRQDDRVADSRAYEDFRRSMAERHAAIRLREEQLAGGAPNEREPAA